MSAAPKLAGLPVTIDGVEHTMPPLNATTSKRYWARIQAMQRGEEPDPMGLTLALVHACLQRNYPDIAEDQVAESVDMDNIEELNAKVFGQGSFRAWCARMAALEGNALAPRPTAEAGTGALSTPTSPPPPAGDSATSTS